MGLPGGGIRGPRRRSPVNDNTADLRVTPGGAAGEPAIVQLAPGSGLTMINLVRTIDPGGSVGSINLERRIDRPEIQISGVIPVRAGRSPARRRPESDAVFCTEPEGRLDCARDHCQR